MPREGIGWPSDGKMPFSYSRDEKIRKSSDYRRVSSGGKTAGAAHLSFRVLRIEEPGREGIRVGLTVSKRVGPAVVRNRLKRVLRELVRLEMKGLEGSWDLVISVKRRPDRIGYGALRDEFLFLLGKIRNLMECRT